MEKMIQIPEWQLKEIEDTLRLVNNIHHSQRKETCFDRCVCKALDFAKSALAKADSTSEKDLRVCSVSGSWLDFDPLINEDSEIDGLIIKHDGGERWGKVAVKTNIGNFAVVSENHEEAVKRIGSRVKVKPDKERYYCVSILEYHDR